jgi:hypothetical protein
MSKRDNSAKAYMLFGDRVGEADLAVVPGSGMMSASGIGFDWLVNNVRVPSDRPYAALALICRIIEKSRRWSELAHRIRTLPGGGRREAVPSRQANILPGMEDAKAGSCAFCDSPRHLVG